MKTCLKIPLGSVILLLCLILPTGTSCGAQMDMFATELIQKLDEKADKVKQFADQKKTAEAVRVSKEALGSIGEIRPLPPRASLEQRIDFMAICEHAYYFADGLFWVYYKAGDCKAAIQFGELALSAAEKSDTGGLNSDYIQTSWVLQIADALAFCNADGNQTLKAIAEYDRGIAFADARGITDLDPEAKWHLGRIHTALAYRLWNLPIFSPRRYTYYVKYDKGVEYLLDGIPSQLDDPEEMHEILSETLFVALEITSDYDSYMARVNDYATRLTIHNLPAVDVVLASVYAYVAYNEYDFKTVQSAVDWNTKAIGKLNFETDKTTASLNLLVQQATFLVTAGDVAGAKTQLDRLKELAPGVSDSIDEITVRGWIAAIEADLHFMAIDAESMLKSWETILNLKYLRADNPDHIWTQVQALLSVAGYHDDADVAVEMLNRADTVLTGMESQGAFEDDVYWLRQYYALTKFHLYGLYWFDAEFTDSIIENTPQNLEEMSLTEMFIMLRFEYLKGDRHTCERLATEMLKRGVSESNLTAMFWAFNYGK